MCNGDITMFKDMIIGILLPFFGTVAGALPVLFTGKVFSRNVGNLLSCFAAGVMVAASVWSLLIPAIECSSAYSRFAFLPATVGFWAGVFCLILTDRLVMSLFRDRMCMRSGKYKSTLVLVLAVALHNFPEGMAVGVAYAGLISGSTNLSVATAFALSLGVAVQNVPEGAVVSLPLRASGMNRGKAFMCGVLSGVVEPIGAVLTILLSFLFVPVLPYFLGFAAGAMVSVVVGELIPESYEQSASAKNTLLFACGFTVMMMLDVALG